MRQSILFHNKRHAQQMGMLEVDAFLATMAIRYSAARRTVRIFIPSMLPW